MQWHDDLPTYETTDENGNIWSLYFLPNPTYKNKSRLMFKLNGAEFRIRTFDVKTAAQDMARFLKTTVKNEETTDATSTI